MLILSAQEIRDWDRYTIEHEPIASIDLMERAAAKCFQWITDQKFDSHTFRIFCGKGNNGGDGLAIARLLFQHGAHVSVYVLETGKKGSEDFEMNLRRLKEISFNNVHLILSKESIPAIYEKEIVIDALFGSGLNKPLEGLAADVAEHLNAASATVISIDLPSGLFVDQSSKGNKIVEADHTLSFECYKLGLLMQENAPFIGEVHLLSIGLHPRFLLERKFPQLVVDPSIIKRIFKPRDRFAHKGNFGHALLIAGSYGKMGAAVLAAKACLHSGVGLLTCYLPKCGYTIMQSSVPEAMVMTDENENLLSQLPADIEKYAAIGIGPGIGTADETQKLISFIIRRYHKPLVIDADGLNCLSSQKELLHQLAAFSVLTPHPKEFDRLFGTHENDFARMEKAKEKAAELNCIIVLKSHHTLIATPSGTLFFNNTGNAGMAKGGSGDVLTGIITALVAQNYSPADAAVLGVYLHGLAGDFASTEFSMESMTATNLIEGLSQSFLKLRSFI